MRATLPAVLVCTGLACLRGAGAQPAPAPPAQRTLEVGFEQRVRSEDWDDITDQARAAADQRIQYRFRTRLWTRLDWDRFELRVGLNSENRKIVRPRSDYAWDEVVFETLYFGYHPGAGIEMHVGRQNLQRGDGFLLFEGNALDGSRSIYFNAASLALERGGSRIELLGIANPCHDAYLPRLHDRDRALTEWDERALGALFTSPHWPRTSLGAYWFYKTETGDTRGLESARFQPDRRLHTLGASGGREFAGGWRLDAEAALQLGHSELPAGDTGALHPLRAGGGQARLGKTLDVRGRPALSLGYAALSGDDPSTHDVEGWDPLFARWPKWSELYIYSLAAESGVAYWTNLSLLQAELRCRPASWLGVRATYYNLRAFETVPGGAAFGPGLDRGDLYQLRGDVSYGAHWNGHALLEYLEPGDFYAGRDGGYFLRFEVSYSAQHGFDLGRAPSSR